MRERQREVDSKEVKEGYEKQEAAKEKSEMQRELKELREAKDKLTKECEEREREVIRTKEEVSVLRARVNEADRGRELIVREMSRSKEED